MKKGLKEFCEVFDSISEAMNLALDLAQNLSFKLNMASPEYAKITEEDVHLAYGLTGMGKKHPIALYGAMHELAKALGYTKEEYIDGSDKRRGRGNCNIYIAGEGSINCDLRDIVNNLEVK